MYRTYRDRKGYFLGYSKVGIPQVGIFPSP
jgi:hypothetical protein